MKGLIGYTGFIGSTLMRSMTFDETYRSTNIQEIQGKSFSTLICAGAPAKKWYANLHPDEDTASITTLIKYLKTVKAEQFTLISTVDVFKYPININEKSCPMLEGLHTYGLNRLRLEHFCQNYFPKCLIVRLPGLVGTGLKKNVLFDFLNNNELEKIDSRNIFQFYPVMELAKDLEAAYADNLSLIHLTSAPISVYESAKVFGLEFNNRLDKPIVTYDFQSIYAGLWGKDTYQYNKEESLNYIRYYAQTEKKRG